MSTREPLCRCGHSKELHEHSRRGTDCARCGAAGCATFKTSRAAGLASIASRLPFDRLIGRSQPSAPVVAHPASSRSDDQKIAKRA